MDHTNFFSSYLSQAEKGHENIVIVIKPHVLLHEHNTHKHTHTHIHPQQNKKP